MRGRFYALLFLAVFTPFFASAAPSTSSGQETCATLSRGMSGPQIAALQKFLTTQYTDFSAKYVTGRFGPITETAVKQWQREHGIEAVGFVGPKTAAAMNISLCANTTAAAAPVSRSTPRPASSVAALIQSLLAQIKVLQEKLAALQAGGTIPPVVTTTPIVGIDDSSRVYTPPVYTPPAVTYTWQTGGWSACTNSSQARTVSCVSSSNTSALESSCTASKPPQMQSCTAAVTPPQCTPLPSESRQVACPAGQTGIITERRTSSCPGPTWSGWTTTSNACIAQQSHYDYGYPLKAGTPLLKDVFDGTAHFQSAQDSQVVPVAFSDASYTAWDTKMSVLKDAQSSAYFTYVRKDSIVGRGDFNIYLMRSDDQGRSFKEVGAIFTPQIGAGGNMETFYEPHIAIDSSQSPTRYIMTLECVWVPGGFEGTASCISISTDPFNRFSWTVPKLIVNGCDTNRATGCTSTEYESGATPATLVDGANTYIAWASVEFPGFPLGGSGTERAFSSVRALGGVDSFAGYANEGTVVLDAKKNTDCTSGWDCNNANVQDWKKEGSLYYMVYNGSNYFACPLLEGRTGPNIWGISLARASSPLGPYTRFGSPLIRAERTDDCGVEYGVINNIEGELYMYYTFHPLTGGTQTRRSKIIWN